MGSRVGYSMATCSKCGAQACAQGARFCSRCAANLTDFKPEPLPWQRSLMKPWFSVNNWVAAFLVCQLLIQFLYCTEHWREFPRDLPPTPLDWLLVPAWCALAMLAVRQGVGMLRGRPRWSRSRPRAGFRSEGAAK